MKLCNLAIHHIGMGPTGFILISLGRCLLNSVPTFGRFCLSPVRWNMRGERCHSQTSSLIEIHIDSSISRLEMEFIGYIGEFNLSYEQLVNSEEKVTDL